MLIHSLKFQRRWQYKQRDNENVIVFQGNGVSRQDNSAIYSAFCQYAFILVFNQKKRRWLQTCLQNWIKWKLRIYCRLTKYIQDNQVDLSYQFTFLYGHQTEVYFCLTIPFSYNDNQQLLTTLAKSYQNDKEIFFNKELLIESEQKRKIDIITITSREEQVDKGVIVMSGRIHSGETPSSHTMNGILLFLLDKKDARAALLRKYFVFKLVPMLNPDGVFNGNFRMDVSNFNLNRYYQQPEKKKQPACYALLNLLKKQKKIVMFIDIHAHSQAKPAFVYGNALEDFVSMVETQLFPKLISLNTQHFDFEHCNFSEKQMAAIDRFECRSKEGSARVQAFKQFGIIHSYTLECGFHQMWAVPLKSKYCSSFPSASKLLEIYSEIGSSLLISILDLFALNPYSRIPTTSIQIIRKEISKSISKLQRFKITDRMTLMKKNQNINELAQELYQENKIMNSTNCEDFKIYQKNSEEQHSNKKPQSANKIRLRSPCPKVQNSQRYKTSKLLTTNSTLTIDQKKQQISHNSTNNNTEMQNDFSQSEKKQKINFIRFTKNLGAKSNSNPMSELNAL